jgi:serpin B
VKSIITIGLTLSLILSGCGESQSKKTEQTTYVEELKSFESRVVSPVYTDTDLHTLVTHNNEFALNIFNTLDINSSENIFISPISISTAFAMLYLGAVGETKDEIQEALRFTQSDDVFFPTYNFLDSQLNNEYNATNLFQESNAIWPQSGLSIKENYLDTLMQHFGASVYTQDYISNPDLARQNINTYVGDKTNNKIQELLSEGSITELTRIVLTNTVYFKGDWKHTFNVEATSEANFTLLDGTTTNVDMMAQREQFLFLKDENISAVELPYVTEENSMLIIMPKRENWAKYINSFDVEKYTNIQESMELELVDVKLPKFSFTSPAYKLVDNFKILGMQQAFTSNANFSNMTSENLTISNIVHKTYLDVNEQGTEATAATAIVIDVSALPVEVREININRPFICIIKNIATKQILFVGTIVNTGQ